MEISGYIPSSEQREVIDFYGGDALVLAPPGCGKTDVLTRRIIKARRDYCVPYDKMLCLTFTNRASREMQERIRIHIAESTFGLFVGNLHRFCVRFLTENALVPHNTSIIDEDDQLEIIADISGYQNHSYGLSSAVEKIVRYASVLTRRKLGLPRSLVDFSGVAKQRLRARDKYIAEKYIEYKHAHSLIDFDDILNLAYAAMMRPDFKSMRYSDYPWVQVDEVQDLNPLQFAIVRKLVSPRDHTLMYLGDERQAIFSFIGASVAGLQTLKEKMRVFTFGTNYRSPKCLLDFINRYAVVNFDVSENELPVAWSDIKENVGITIFMTDDNTGGEQEALIAAQTRQLEWFSKGESIGVLARTNREVDVIAQCFDEHNIEYLRMSRRDLFKSVDYKTVYSHFAVISNEFRSNEWCRILYQTGTVTRMQEGRSFYNKLRKNGLAMTDMLRVDNSSYMLEFSRSAEENEMVVFDTETTGLNVYEDDVIQIAAVKINSQGIIPGSEFEIVIETDREIPEFLGTGSPNPMREVYESQNKVSFDSAWRAFEDYVGERPLVGHNVNFDTQILRMNLLRRVGYEPESSCLDRSWDTYKLARLCDPELHSYGLASLLAHYELEGVNSHNAVDDVKATANLLMFLKAKMCDILLVQMDLLESREVEKVRRRLRSRYKGYYDHTLRKLNSPHQLPENGLIPEFEWVYENFVADKYIKPIRKIDYVQALFRKVMVDEQSEPRFGQQLANHIYDMRTFSEGDFYDNGVVKEMIHIMTIHKAKGLQFDNVFVAGVESFPNYMDKGDDAGMGESQRVLYVAISRARRRLYLCCNRECSEFIDDTMLAMCARPSQAQLVRILQLESVYSEATSKRR